MEVIKKIMVKKSIFVIFAVGVYFPLPTHV